MSSVVASVRTLLSQDVLPVALVFGVVVALLVHSARRVRSSGPGPSGAVPLAPRMRSFLFTALGGYGVFVVLTAGISLLAGESGSYIGDALLGGAVLAFAVVTPLALAAIWLEHRFEGRERS